jgi:DnaK suppressor protein
MKTFEIKLTQAFDRLLSDREQELCVALRAHEKLHSANTADRDEVTDFKDLAGEQSLASVDQAQGEHAAMELEQVLAARRRLHDHSYGRCLDCDKAIDLRRLTAMPATAYCTKCQALHESTGAPPRVH